MLCGLDSDIGQNLLVLSDLATSRVPTAHRLVSILQAVVHQGPGCNTPLHSSRILEYDLSHDTGKYADEPNDCSMWILGCGSLQHARVLKREIRRSQGSRREHVANPDGGEAHSVDYSQH